MSPRERERSEREQRLQAQWEREERERLEIARERLAFHRHRLERERMERERLERERMHVEQERRREQERIHREREELRRQQELRYEQERRPALRRPYELDRWASRTGGRAGQVGASRALSGARSLQPDLPSASHRPGWTMGGVGRPRMAVIAVTAVPWASGRQSGGFQVMSPERWAWGAWRPAPHLLGSHPSFTPLKRK